MSSFFDCSPVKVRRGPMPTFNSPPRPKPKPEPKPDMTRANLQDALLRQMQGMQNISGMTFGQVNPTSLFPGQVIPMSNPNTGLLGGLGLRGLFG